MFPSLRTHSRLIHVATFALAVLMSTSACSTESKIKRHMERGDEYLEEGKYQEAIIEFLNVIQLDADHRDATQRLGIASAARLVQRRAELRHRLRPRR